MTRSAARVILVLGLALGVPSDAGGGPAAADTQIFVLFPTLTGGSTEPGHEGWSELVSLGHAGCRLASAGGPQLGAIRLLKVIDTASGGLREAFASGSNLGEVVVEVVESTTGDPFWRIVVMPTEIASATSARTGPDGRPRELVTLVFADIEWTYFDEGTPVITSFDLTTGGSFGSC